MTILAEGETVGAGGRGRLAFACLVIAAGIVGAVVAVLMLVTPGLLVQYGSPPAPDAVAISLYGAGAVFLLLGGLVALPRAVLGGAIALLGIFFWMAACISSRSFDWLLAAPPVLGLVGAVGVMISHDRHAAGRDPSLVYRQDGLTRVTHWVWAVTMFFMLLSGLQIFNARPNLYIGQESGFTYQNSILDIYAANRDGELIGQTRLFGQVYETTGWLGVSGPPDRPAVVAFPGWATIPSYRDLGTGRVVHFFFAWILVGTLAIWLVNALFTGHLWRDIILKPRDVRELPADIWNHMRLRFAHTRTYSPLQKLAYFLVFVVAFPLIILTGLTMSPGLNAAWPWMLDLLGGRQTARTIHFFAMLAFVLFFVVHIVMVVLAGPFNELRSMITGYYRTKTREAE